MQASLSYLKNLLTWTYIRYYKGGGCHAKSDEDEHIADIDKNHILV